MHERETYSWMISMLKSVIDLNATGPEWDN